MLNCTLLRTSISYWICLATFNLLCNQVRRFFCLPISLEWIFSFRFFCDICHIYLQHLKTWLSYMYGHLVGNGSEYKKYLLKRKACWSEQRLANGKLLTFREIVMILCPSGLFNLNRWSWKMVNQKIFVKIVNVLESITEGIILLYIVT